VGSGIGYSRNIVSVGQVVCQDLDKLFSCIPYCFMEVFRVLEMNCVIPPFRLLLGLPLVPEVRGLGVLTP
jgi:hypothetical protein